MGNLCSCYQEPNISPPPTTSDQQTVTPEGSVAVSTQNVQIRITNHDLPPTPNRKVTAARRLLYRAMFDYEPLTTDDLSFRKGDLLEVRSDSVNEDWWQARNLSVQGQQEHYAYIPRNYVCKFNTPQMHEYWFDVTRDVAVTLLLRDGNKLGTFLVRYATDRTSMALSVRDVDESGQPCVRHYRVQQKSNGDVSLSSSWTFHSLQELIEHCTANPTSGLCTQLTETIARSAPAPTTRLCEVRRDEVRLLEKVGSGCYGIVFKGRLKNTTDVAVKKLKSTSSMTSEKFLEEAKTMHKLQHERLVQLVAVVTEDEPFLIVTEFMANGSLLHYLRQDGGVTVSYMTLVNMAAQIAEGMAFLEQKHYIHRDLRAANILVGEYLEVKVADFGLARFLENDAKYQTLSATKFPVRWTAPEAAKFGGAFTHKSDVWSYGVLLYEMITFGKEPYPGMTGASVLCQLESGYRMPKPSSPVRYNDVYYDVILNCWNAIPTNRPTFEHLYHHFNDYRVSTEEQYVD